MPKKEKNKYKKVLYVSIVILIIAILISFILGRYDISIVNFFDVIKKAIINDENINQTYKTIILNIRLPRIIFAITIGAALAVSGAIYQSIFQNPMASPDILGTTNAAATGAALAILFNFNKTGIIILSFIFGVVVIFIVFAIGNVAKGNKLLNLILAGIIISSIFQSITSYIKLVADPTNKLPAITYWLMGSLSNISNKEIIYVVFPILIALVFAYILRWKLNILSLGEEEAKSLGVDINLYRLIFILIATILTAIAVAFSGVISYVGLVIPNFSRKLVGDNNIYIIPISVIFGAIFLLLVDNISRNLLLTEIPIGILTSIVGAPFFLYLIFRSGGENA